MRTKDEIITEYEEVLGEETEALLNDKKAICLIALTIPILVEVLIDIRDVLRLKKPLDKL